MYSLFLKNCHILNIKQKILFNRIKIRIINILIQGNVDSKKNFIIDLWKLTFKTQENNVFFNQVSKLAQTLKKTLHYKGLRGRLKVQLRHSKRQLRHPVFFVLCFLYTVWGYFKFWYKLIFHKKYRKIIFIFFINLRSG